MIKKSGFILSLISGVKASNSSYFSSPSFYRMEILDDYSLSLKKSKFYTYLIVASLWIIMGNYLAFLLFSERSWYWGVILCWGFTQKELREWLYSLPFRPARLFSRSLVPFDQPHNHIKGEEAFMPDFQQYSNLEDSVLIIATEQSILLAKSFSLNNDWPCLSLPCSMVRTCWTLQSIW